MLFARALLPLPLLVCACAATRERARDVDRVTVLLILEGHRPFIELTFQRADGKTRTGRFLVDSGGGSFLITEPLAREIGLAWGEVSHEEGKTFAAVTSPPNVSVGDFALELDARRVAVVLGEKSLLPAVAPGHADGLFPGHLLARYHVVFDYPAARFTIARPGVLTPRGRLVPMPVSQGSGFPRTELEIDGVTHGFLIDTGAAFTMVSEALLKTWGGAHTDWERHSGAFGDAQLLGGQTLETLFLPTARWDGFALDAFGVTSQRAGTFEKWMSSMMSAPIVGSLAGNVLERFRVELDYPHQMLYLERPSR